MLKSNVVHKPFLMCLNTHPLGCKHLNFRFFHSFCNISTQAISILKKLYNYIYFRGFLSVISLYENFFYQPVAVSLLVETVRKTDFENVYLMLPE